VDIVQNVETDIGIEGVIKSAAQDVNLKYVHNQMDTVWNVVTGTGDIGVTYSVQMVANSSVPKTMDSV